mgnify:CR=1 FL=1
MKGKKQFIFFLNNGRNIFTILIQVKILKMHSGENVRLLVFRWIVEKDSSLNVRKKDARLHMGKA